MDVLLYQTVDDGDINITGGVTELTGGFDTALYISLFGGPAWWGDLLDGEPVECLTQTLLAGIPASPANLKRVEEAVKQDLQWFLDYGIAESITVTASIPAYGKILIEGTINEKPFSFIENWRAV